MQKTSARRLFPALAAGRLCAGLFGCGAPVSYTHLTLPTKA